MVDTAVVHLAVDQKDVRCPGHRDVSVHPDEHLPHPWLELLRARLEARDEVRPARMTEDGRAVRSFHRDRGRPVRTKHRQDGRAVARGDSETCSNNMCFPTCSLNDGFATCSGPSCCAGIWLDVEAPNYQPVNVQLGAAPDGPDAACCPADAGLFLYLHHCPPGAPVC